MRINHHGKFPVRNSTCPDDRAHLLHCENVNGLKTHTLTALDTNRHTGNCNKFSRILFYFTNYYYLRNHPMLDHDALDTDLNVYEPWDFHDPWDSLVNFLLGGKSLLQQAREGHGRASFFIWEKWMKTVSKDTQ